jgi:hypothetical protein
MMAYGKYPQTIRVIRKLGPHCINPTVARSRARDHVVSPEKIYDICLFFSYLWHAIRQPSIYLSAEMGKMRQGRVPDEGTLQWGSSGPIMEI